MFAETQVGRKKQLTRLVLHLQLFIHHYLCGLLFAILLSAVTLEHLLVLVLPQSRRTLVYGAVAVALAAVFVHGFIQFAPFA